MTTLSVVIPAYNEENGIKDIVERVLAVEPDLVKVGVERLELVVVDDGSKDRTAEIVSGYKTVRLIRHVKNRGYGGALKNGFAQSTGDLIGFLDADGTYPPEYFPKLCVEAMKGGELVIGSRMAGEQSEMPVTRRVGNFFFANLLSLVGRQRVTDSASGMRVFKREILERMYPLPDGLNLTPVMSTRAIHEGIKVVEVPIPYSERVGRSKLSVVRDGTVFLKSILWTALSYNPVRILGLLGLGGVGFALLTGLALVFARLSGVTNLTGWSIAALYWALVSGVAGITIFSLGATFNYLVSLFYKRPIQQGLFGKPIFKNPLDRQFGWMGALSFLVGLAIGIVSVALGVSGWDINRLWLYLIGSSLFILVGIQLLISWIVMRVLEDLSQREIQASQDMDAAAKN
ncbi:MAG: glycosyltransferase family 2 protein [Anaerolineae bacterium]|nr:glycosyltransferase family 2 protein [Anaerolineae bacterium]